MRQDLLIHGQGQPEHPDQAAAHAGQSILESIAQQFNDRIVVVQLAFVRPSGST